LLAKNPGHTKRGVHSPSPHEAGMGSLTIISPAEDGDAGDDHLRVEYASPETTDESVVQPESTTASEHPAAQVAAAIAGPELSVAHRTFSDNAPPATMQVSPAASLTPAAEQLPPAPLSFAPPPTGPASGTAVPPPASYVP